METSGDLVYLNVASRYRRGLTIPEDAFAQKPFFRPKLFDTTVGVDSKARFREKRDQCRGCFLNRACDDNLPRLKSDEILALDPSDIVSASRGNSADDLSPRVLVTQVTFDQRLEPVSVLE